MKRIVYIFLICQILIPWNQNARAQDGYELLDLKFTGNNVFSNGDLQEHISAFAINRFESWILRKDRYLFSKDMLSADINKLLHFYRQEGFLQANITYQIENIKPDELTLDLQINVVEGPAVRVDSVIIKVRPDSAGMQLVSDELMSDIYGNINLKKGERFRDVEIEADQKRIVTGFVNSGYPYIKVKPSISLADGDSSAMISWWINPGPLSRFGELIITGANKVSDGFITSRLAFEAGEVYRQVLLDTSSQAIYSLGLFQVVGIKAILQEDRTPVIPIKITLMEAPRTTTRFGAGYGSEEKIRVFGEIQRLAFLGGARRLTLFGRHSGLEPYHIDLKFTQPGFFIQSLNFILNPFIRKQDEPGFKVSRLGVRGTFLYPLPFKLNTSLTYTYEEVNQDTVDFNSIGGINEDNYKGLYDKSMISLGLTRDTSEPLLYPQQGTLVALNLQYNGITTIAEFPYLKTLIDARVYRSISSVILAGRAKIGSIQPQVGNGFIPVEERFYSGGSYSVRGWARSELGPKDEQGHPLGGNSILELSTEIRFPVYDIVNGVAFMDCGNVWLSSYTYPFNELRYAVGVGLRIKTPIGPVRFDLAKPVFDIENKIQFHFSVGHAF